MTLQILVLACLPIGYLMFIGAVFSNLSLLKAMLVGYTGCILMTVPAIYGACINQ